MFFIAVPQQAHKNLTIGSSRTVENLVEKNQVCENIQINTYKT